MSTLIDYKKLRNKLPRGYAKKVAKLTSKSPSAVYKVATGEMNSTPILAALVEMAKEHSQNSNDFASQINSL